MNNKPGFRNWDERYAYDDYVFGTEPNDFLKFVAAQIPADSRVLCLADGEGRNGVYLASLGHRVTSIDQSRAGLDKAERLADARGVAIETIQADLSTYDLGSECWDCVVSIFFHIPPAVRDIIYPGIIQSLAPDGLLILESYTPAQLAYGTGGLPVAEMMLTLDIVRHSFGELEFLHATETVRDVIEGSGHTGEAAVLQLLAKKNAS